MALLYRLYWLVGMDVGLHILVRLLARWLPGSWTRLCYRQVIPRLVPKGWKVVDRSDRQLTMQHELFRHIEIEVFVTRSRLAEAIEFVVWLLRRAGGEAIDPPNRFASGCKPPAFGNDSVFEGSISAPLPDLYSQGSARRHIDLMSSAGIEPYALSFISYARPRARILPVCGRVGRHDGLAVRCPSALGQSLPAAAG